MRLSTRFLCLSTSVLLMMTGCGSPPPGGLSVSVQPLEAKIFLEGEFRGVGNAEIEDLQAPFDYTLRIEPPPGWVLLIQKVQVEPGRTTRLELELQTVEEALLQAEEERRAAEEKPWGGDPTLPVVVLTTSLGEMEFRLFEDDAPNTVANFVALSRRGFYDGVSFHRVIDGFMVQTGDPLSRDTDPRNDGTGGPGYAIPDEISRRIHDQLGVLSMANSGPDTNGSQFFVTLGPAPHLNGRHTVFGILTRGFDVLREIGRQETDERDRPLEVIRIETAEVVSARKHPYVPTGLDGARVPLPELRR